MDDLPKQTRLIIKMLRENYDRYFTRAYRYRYWLVIVNNHFEDVYSIFLYTQKIKTKLERSYELVNFKRNDVVYDDVLAALRTFSHLNITFRNTQHLVHPGHDVEYDKVHGHGV